MSTLRKKRVGDLVLSFLAEEVRRLRDPRLQFVTITDVSVSADLKIVHIYWTVLSRTLDVGDGSTRESNSFPDALEVEEVRNALSRASGYLKKKMGEQLKLRYMPQLFFDYDGSLKHGSRIDELLDKVREE